MRRRAPKAVGAPPARRRSATRRAPALFVLAAVLIAGIVIERNAGDAVTGDTAGVDTQVPIAAPASARSSAWYCPGVPVAGALGEGSVVVANAGDRPLAGSVTVFPNQGENKTIPLSVGPAGRTSLRLADVVTSPFAAALIELDGGEAVTEVMASGPLGDTVSPCASSASSSWYFAEGVTTRDATEVLLALNPFPDDAVVDVVFSTEEGVVTPQALTGLLVKGQALTSINVGDFVQRRESVAVTLTARTGRLAVGRVQAFDGSGTRKGVSVALGAAALGPVWYFPEGLVADGLQERYIIYNPGREEAQVEVALTLDTGDAEPLRLTIPRESRLTLVAGEESRIPKGVPHSVMVTAVQGPAVVVERTVDGQSPSSRVGMSITLGARLPAKKWVVAAGATSESLELWVVVQNPGTRTASVTLNLLAGGTKPTVGTFAGVDIPAGGRRAFRVNDSLGAATASLLVTSSEPVVVERDQYRLKAPGLAMAAATPLR